MTRLYIAAGLIGAGMALAGGAWWYVEAQRRDAAAQALIERDARDALRNEETRALIRGADRSIGDVDADHFWLCERFAVGCVSGSSTD